MTDEQVEKVGAALDAARRHKCALEALSEEERQHYELVLRFTGGEIPGKRRGRPPKQEAQQ